MCLYPTLIANPKYKPNKKNGYFVPILTDKRIAYVPIGCGNCIECCKQKANSWKIRLQEDIKVNNNATFITLTFSDQEYYNLSQTTDLTGYPLDNHIATIGVRRFLERWRKEHKKSLRHFLITELGHRGTKNVHLHGLLWSKDINKIRQKWNYGYIFAGTYVNARTITYISKYITKRDVEHKTYKPIILTSPGIGANYINTYNAKKNKFNLYDTNDKYKTSNGHETALPIYWRNKIYNDTQRELLWLQKLDLEERWVCGHRIDISNGTKDYTEALEHYRQLNKDLGYGGLTKDEEYRRRKYYEDSIRLIYQETRLQRGKPKE